jgi:hypothetical protein
MIIQNKNNNIPGKQNGLSKPKFLCRSRATNDQVLGYIAHILNSSQPNFWTVSHKKFLAANSEH